MPRASKAAAQVIQLAEARARRAAKEHGYRSVPEHAYLPLHHHEASHAALERAFALLSTDREQLFAAEAEVTEALELADSRMVDEDEADPSTEFPAPTDYARAFARQLADTIVRRVRSHGHAIFAPRFSADPNGGVGLHWRTRNLELLVVVPAESGASIQFYGDTPRGAVVKGSFFGIEETGFLAHWLASHEFSG